MTGASARPAVATTTARRALLRACLASDGDLPDRLREWEAAVELDDVVGDIFALLPFLYQRLQRAGVTARDHGRLKGIYARAWVVDERAGGTAAAVAAVDPGAVVLRGVALRLLAYESGATRAVDDGVVLTRLTAFADTTADPAVVERALASARPVGDPGVLTPAPAYHLLDALLRGTGWFPDPGLRPLLDAGLLAQRLDRGDWELVVDETRRCGWRPLVEPRLRELADVGGAVPGDVLGAVAALPSSTSATLVVRGARNSGWRRRALRGLYGLYLADPDRAHGPRTVVDYPVRNVRLAAAALRRRHGASPLTTTA